MTPQAPRCAEAARARYDPLLGTAPVTRAYLLIEHAGPWRFDALSGAGWSSAVTAKLAETVRETRSRLLLIRRPGRRAPAADRAWAVVRVGIGTLWGSWQQESDLLIAADALRSCEDQPAGSSAPVLLVCAHGVHDACCAIRGRPVAARLAESWPEQTWECSHVGGDRFAANLVVLPDGTYYGGLDADSVAGVVESHVGGRIEVPYLRGSACWPPVAQVAVAEIHRRQGPYGASDVHPESWTPQEAGGWLVRAVDRHGRRYLVEVVVEPRPPEMLTCAATRATSAHGYRVVFLGTEP